jgi:8-oxo-dGTP diphosphatase
MSRPQSVAAAVAVLLREDGQVLLGQRPQGKPWAGWWEFPGGKIEEGETPYHALQRELHEELGIDVSVAHPWITRTFAYPERTVRLSFFTVRAWQGEPHGREGQQLSWQDPAAVGVGPLLPANEPVLAMLSLPPVYAISNLGELGEEVFFRRLQIALERGLRLLQVREKQLDVAALERFAGRVVALCQPYAARVLLNGSPEMARAVGADGVHLSAARLMALQERPPALLCAASCHTTSELRRAAELGLDFALLSPVMRTRSHPDIAALGWDNFMRMAAGCAIPVYALGGLWAGDLQAAWEHGAHGIAMQRAVWGA